MHSIRINILYKMSCGLREETRKQRFISTTEQGMWTALGSSVQSSDWTIVFSAHKQSHKYWAGDRHIRSTSARENSGSPLPIELYIWCLPCSASCSSLSDQVSWMGCIIFGRILYAIIQDGELLFKLSIYDMKRRFHYSVCTSTWRSLQVTTLPSEHTQWNCNDTISLCVFIDIRALHEH